MNTANGAIKLNVIVPQFLSKQKNIISKKSNTKLLEHCD